MLELRILRSISVGKIRDLLGGFADVVVQHQCTAVGRKRNRADIRRDQLQPMLLQSQVADNIGTERARTVRQRRTTEPGVEFFCDSGAAGLLAAFNDEWLESSFGEIEGSNQAIVSAANNNDVSLVGHDLRRPFPVFEDFQSRQPSVRAHDAAARMGSRSAQVEVLDGGAILGPTRNRTQEEKLFER